MRGLFHGATWLVVLGVIAAPARAAITACDELAASEHDANAVGPGVAPQALDAEAAVAACSAAIEQAPDTARFHFQLGRALTMRNRHKQALQSYRRALELDPHYAAAAIGIGLAYLGGRGVERDYAEALKLFRSRSDHPAAQPPLP